MPDEFWSLTMREFRLMQSGHMKMEADKRIHEWNIARTLGVFTLSPHMKKGKKLKPKDLISLPIDDKQIKTDSVEERRKKAALALKKREYLKSKKSKNG